MTPGSTRVKCLIAATLLASSAWSGCHSSDGTAPAEGAVDTVRAAFEARRSGLMVAVPARVVRVLSDDTEGSRHQRFIVELDDSHTLLVSHNIDLADRVPIDEGDSVFVRGQYEWNPQGGVVHWTHADPDGRREGGWIRHRGVFYR